MSDPLYKKEVLRLAADATGAGRLAQVSGTGTAHNPSCGDKAHVDLALADGRIEAMAHDTKACVLSQASASILGKTVFGSSKNQVAALLAEVKTMLEGGNPPSAPFGDYAVFDGVATFRNRHKCVTLPIEATLAAFENSESAEKGSKGSKA